MKLPELRAIIVDDEAPARQRLQELLTAHPHVTVIGEANSVANATILCADLQPNLLFLDVQLEDESSFDLLPKLDPVPAIIFVTGYAEFAIRAFEVNAIDYLAGLIWGALQGLSKEQLLATNFSPIENLWKSDPLCPEIAEIASGSFKRKQPPEIRGSGYVVKSLEAALWAFYNSADFKSGCLLAINLGDDADTTGAIYGQIAGAFYGRVGIPATWLQRLAHRQMIETLAHDLWGLSGTIKISG